MEELQEQGALNSSGRFTLDPRRARELLRDCQLAEGHHYILCLVSFLVGMGARRILLNTRANEAELRAEGLLLSQEVLANPLEGLFSAQRSAALRELAIGVNSALGYGGSSITLRCSDGLGADYEEREFRSQNWPGDDKMDTVFTIRHSQATTLEAEAVSRYFAHCPIDVLVNGEPISSPLQAPDSCFVVQLLPTQAGPGQSLNVSPRDCLEIYQHPAPLHACLWLGAQPQVCHWIFLGRTYSKPMPWKARSGELPVQMWVACDHLDKDLSLGSLLENERYQKVTHFLRQTFLQTVDELLERALKPESFRADQMSRLRPLLVYALEASARQSHVRLAYDLQKTLMTYPSSSSDEALDQYRLALLRNALEREEMSPPPEPETSVEELWAAARASLAIRGVQNYKARQLLFRCGEKAYEEGRHDIAASCLGPHLAANPSRSESIQAIYGHSLLALGRVPEARLILEKSVSALRAEADIPEWGLLALEHLANADAQLGNLQEACSTLADVLRRRQLKVGSRSRQLGLLLNKLALLCGQLHDDKLARHFADWANQLDE